MCMDTNLSRLRCRYLPALLKLYNAPRLKPNFQRILFLAGTKLVMARFLAGNMRHSTYFIRTDGVRKKFTLVYVSSKIRI